MSEPESKATIQRIINLRKENNLTQAQLASKMGVGNTVMSKIENGTRGISADELSQIATVFDTTTDYLLGRHVNKKRAPAPNYADLARAVDENEYTTYHGKRLSQDDKDVIKALLKKYDRK